MYMGITYVILLDMFNHLAEKDKKYFRESREQMFNGHKLEDVSCALNATCCNCVQLKLYTPAVGNHAHACSCSLNSFVVQVCADTDAKVQAFRKEMAPLRKTLGTNQFLGGSKPNYADIAVAGNFLVIIHP